jgi:hypothetical protein
VRNDRSAAPGEPATVGPRGGPGRVGYSMSWPTRQRRNRYPGRLGLWSLWDDRCRAASSEAIHRPSACHRPRVLGLQRGLRVEGLLRTRRTAFGVSCKPGLLPSQVGLVHWSTGAAPTREPHTCCADRLRGSFPLTVAWGVACAAGRFTPPKRAAQPPDDSFPVYSHTLPWYSVAVVAEGLFQGGRRAVRREPPARVPGRGDSRLASPERPGALKRTQRS